MVRLSGATQTRLSRAGRWRSVFVRFCSLQAHPGAGVWDVCGSGAVERRLAGIIGKYEDVDGSLKFE